jgi:hypothetical protein
LIAIILYQNLKIILYLNLIFFALLIEYNIAKNWPSLFSVFFGSFILFIIFIVSLYLFMLKNIL